MTKGIILTIVLFTLSLCQSFAQNRTHQISFNGGLGILLLQDDLWGNQIYRGFSKDLSLDYSWGTHSRSNSIYFNAGSGSISVPNSIRQNSDAYQFYLRYHHLRKVTTFERSKISWAVGGSIATFLQFRIQNRYTDNNLASFDLGSSLQLQNRFNKTLVPNKIEFSFLVETAFASAYLTPSYASSNTEKPLNASGLNDVTIGDITSRMSIVSFPSLFRMNMYSTMYIFVGPKAGVRLDYNWQVIRSKSKRKSVAASHHLQFGIFVRFGKTNAS